MIKILRKKKTLNVAKFCTRKSETIIATELLSSVRIELRLVSDCGYKINK